MRDVERLDTVIVGAGPFGLSVAAHLSRRGSARAFGEPMRTWRTLMPPDMRLRSGWQHTNLSAPGRAGTLDEWVRSGDGERIEPLPLQQFLRYADWFRQKFVPDLDPTDVTRLELADGGVRLATADGDEIQAKNAVLAPGVTPFPRVPPVLAASGDPRIRIVLERSEYDDLGGKRVAVIGAGNNGVESALLAHRADARVELLARSRVHWFTEHEPHTRRSPLQQRLYDLAYPVVGFGPPPINRFAMHPDAFARLPHAARKRLSARLLRPGAAPWLREHVEGVIPISRTWRCGAWSRARTISSSNSATARPARSTRASWPVVCLQPRRADDARDRAALAHRDAGPAAESRWCPRCPPFTAASSAGWVTTRFARSSACPTSRTTTWAFPTPCARSPVRRTSPRQRCARRCRSRTALCSSRSSAHAAASRRSAP